MEIIRVVKDFDDYENVYILMDINWFREKVWRIRKVDGLNMGGDPHVVRQERTFYGPSHLVDAIKTKLKTEKSKRLQSIKKVPAIVLLGHHGIIDESSYITVRYFPGIFGKWVDGLKFIKDIITQDLEENFPEYII